MEFLKGLLSQLTVAELITYSTLAASILFSVSIALITAYKRVRHSIRSNVNCWFCNENSKVLYATRNNWTCPKCQQYNGFTKDGNYNKRIPGQYIESLNRPVRGAPAKGYEASSHEPSNGLCSQCNLNQELKCFQLASFIPTNDKNFDKEIEEEQQRLERIYDLCEPCKSVVKSTLSRSTSEKSDLHDKKTTTVEAPGSKSPSRSPQSTPSPRAPSSLRTSLEGILPWAHNTSQQVQANRNQNSFFYDSEAHRDDNSCKMEKLQISSESKLRASSPSSYTSYGHNKMESCDPVFNSRQSPSLNPYFPYGQSFYPIQYPTPPSPPSSITPPSQAGQTHNSVTGGQGSPTQHLPPPWQDYPESRCPGVPSCYSYNSYSDSNYPSYPLGRPTPTFAYNYRSSSMANVFGGRKPLLSPSRLSYGLSYSYSQSSQQQPSVPSYGGYGVGIFYKYGSNTGDLLLPPQHPCEHPFSRSSSQSSGFVSQFGTATPAESRYSTAPNSVIGDEPQQTNPSTTSVCSNLQYQCKNKKTPVLLHDEPLFHSNGFRFTAKEASPARVSPNNKSLASSSVDNRTRTFGKFEGCDKSIGDTYSRLRQINNQKSFRNDQIFSEDEDQDEDSPSNSSVQTIGKQSVLRRRMIDITDKVKKHISSKKPVHNKCHIESKQGSSSPYNKSGSSANEENQLVKYRHMFYQFCLRLFIFLNVLVVFCIFFVGKWPEPLDFYVETVTEMYQDLWDHLITTVLTVISSTSDFLFQFISLDDSVRDADAILGLKT